MGAHYIIYKGIGLSCFFESDLCEFVVGGGGIGNFYICECMYTRGEMMSVSVYAGEACESGVSVGCNAKRL